MKTCRLSLLILILMSQQVIAQLKCGVIPLTATQSVNLKNSLNNSPTSLPSNATIVNGITYIPIKPHLVGMTDGTGKLDLGILNRGLALLNRDFLPQNLQFYFCGTMANAINNSSYYNYNYSDEDNLANGNHVDDAINVFFVNSITRDSYKVGGYAYLPHPTTNKKSNRVFLANNQVIDGSLQHEFGHYFSLYHTFDNSTNATIAERETVVRTGLGANCSTKGDEICDTPADPLGLPGVSYFNCTYDGTATDVNGDMFSPQVNNVMSYTYYNCPFYLFTPGQYNRIGQGLSLRLSYASQNGGYNIQDCPPTTLTAPSSVTASRNASNVVITWVDNSSTEMGFIIERSTSPTTGFTAVYGVSPNVTTFIDNNVANGSSYYYRIKASNTTNNYSNVASVGGAECPTDLVLTNYANSDVQLFKASNSITSTSLISGTGTDITYKASSRIILNQGFKVEKGAIFKGIISACNTIGSNQQNIAALHVKNEIEGIELLAYPNPVTNGDITVQYVLPEDSYTNVYIADMSGINIKDIVSDKLHTKGIYIASISLSDLSPGMYLCILQSDRFKVVKKMIVE